MVPKKFLLGTEKRAAQMANLRLEQLWGDVVRLTEEENCERSQVHEQWLRSLAEEGATAPASSTPVPQESLWDEDSLKIADEFRRGASQIVVPVPEHGDVTDRMYVQYLTNMRRRYPSVTFVPGNAEAFVRGQATFKQDARRHAKRAADAAAVAEITIPSEAGQSLHGALDDYIEWIKSNKVKGGKLTAWGKVLSDQVRRLKSAHPDVPLAVFDFNALEKIKTYWSRRPTSKKYAVPVAIDTVRTHLNAARMFVKWLHKNPTFKWRKPDDWEDALKCDLAGLMTDEEIANLRRGPETFTVDELTTIYRYATDRERVLILLGLNIGAARAECNSLRVDEVDLNGTPPTIKRIRRKTRTYGEFTLWPETVNALRWIAAERAAVEPKGNKLAILTERGHALGEARIANQWNRLIERIKKNQADFRFLPFKHLRKTGAQLVRNVSDGETAGTFLCHGTPVKTDELSDVYSRRDFSKVAAALSRVRETLAPVFHEMRGSFAGPRLKGGPNITRNTIDSIEELHGQGFRPNEIAGKLGVSRATAYRRVAKLKAVDKGNNMA